MRALAPADIEEILHGYLSEHLTQEEAARRYRVSAQLVSKLVQLSKKAPEKLR